MTVDVRTLTEADLPDLWAVLETVFAAVPDPEGKRLELANADAGRFYGGVDTGATAGLVCTSGSYRLSMAVPGAVADVAGVSQVGVLPTHRRQGLLRTMMRRQLDDLHAEGTAVSALWATEGAIYQRFGYGPGAWNLGVRVPAGAPFAHPVEPGRTELGPPSADRLRGVYDEVAARTPGWAARDDAWWAYRLHDPEHARDGGTPLQCVTTDGGYALYSALGRYDDAGPAGEVRVRELVSADPQAHARLWRFLLDLDLMRTVEYRNTAPDDALVHSLLATPRNAAARLRESLWVRLVDVAAALALRTYASPVDAVLEVEDEFCPWNAGRFRLTGDRSGAQCTATDDPADLRLRVADLGAAFLGGTPLRTRPAVELTPGTFGPVSTAFGPVDRAPSCPMVF